MLMISAWWTRRSIMAAATLSSSKRAASSSALGWLANPGAQIVGEEIGRRRSINPS